MRLFHSIWLNYNMQTWVFRFIRVLLAAGICKCTLSNSARNASSSDDGGPTTVPVMSNMKHSVFPWLSSAVSKMMTTKVRYAVSVSMASNAFMQHVELPKRSHEFWRMAFWEWIHSKYKGKMRPIYQGFGRFVKHIGYIPQSKIL